MAAICYKAPLPVAGGRGANQNTIAIGSPIDIVLHIGILLLTCNCKLYKLMEEGGKLKELLCAGSSALAPENVRDRLKAEILGLTDSQAEFVLKKLQCLLQEKD